MAINNIEEGVIHFDKDSFHFIKTGNGPRLAITFHGMWSAPNRMFIIQEHLLDQYTFVSFFLPYHGPQEINSKALKPEAIMAVIQGVKNNFNVKQFSLWGHSIGARICLKIVELQGNWVDELILISPDGIAKNPWYQLATVNKAGRYIFKIFVKYPEKFVNFIEKTRLSPKSKINLAKRTIKDKEKLQQIYSTWTSLHYMAPFIPVVKANIKKNKIDTHIFIGTKDQIIPLKPLKSFARKHANIHLHEIDGGHHLLTEKYLEYFLNVLK